MQLRTRLVQGCIAGTVALAACISTTGAAQFDSTTKPDPIDQTSVGQMVDGGFDAAVAKSNGFKIQVSADGTQTPIPVTASAKAMVKDGTVDSSPSRAATRSGTSTGGVTTNAVAPGTCGTSMVTATKTANDVLKIYTGYDVGFSVQNRVWEVTAAGVISGHNFDFPQGGSGPTWRAGMQAAVPGPGLASVQLFSFVVGYNGKVCHSNGPIDSYS